MKKVFLSLTKVNLGLLVVFVLSPFIASANESVLECRHVLDNRIGSHYANELIKESATAVSQESDYAPKFDNTSAPLRIIEQTQPTATRWQIKTNSRNGQVVTGQNIEISTGDSSYSGLFAGASKFNIWIINPVTDSIIKFNRNNIDASGVSFEETLPNSLDIQCRPDCRTKSLLNAVSRVYMMRSGRPLHYDTWDEDKLYNYLYNANYHQFPQVLYWVLKSTFDVESKYTVSISSLIKHLRQSKPAIIGIQTTNRYRKLGAAENNQVIFEDQLQPLPINAFQAESGHAVAAYGFITTKRNFLGADEGYIIIGDTAHGEVSFYKTSELKAAGQGSRYFLLNP